MTARRAKNIALVSMGLACSLLLAGCTPASEPEAQPSSVPSATEAPAFPTTLVFEGGEVTLDSRPERVVTIGAPQTDAVLALGTVPVGIEKAFVAPWREEAIAAVGGEAPVILTPNSYYGDIAGSAPSDVEALAPDLILAGLMYCVYDCDPEPTAEFYSSLDGVAPTVFPTTAAIAPEGYSSATAWREALMQAGQALGQTKEAQSQLDSIDASFSDAAAAHPEFSGKTIATVGAAEGGYYVRTASSPFSALLADLGFSPLDVSTIELDAVDESGSAVLLTYDQVTLLDVDIIVIGADEAADSAVSKSLTAANGVVFYAGNAEPSYWGVAQPTALSVPWALDTFVQNLADALAS